MDGTSSYEFMKLMTHNCQREKVIDGEMAYDENEDVAWQGKEVEHGYLRAPQTQSSPPLLFMSL